MRRLLFILAFILALMPRLAVGGEIAKYKLSSAQPPDILVTLAVDKAKYYPDQPIWVSLGAQYTGSKGSYEYVEEGFFDGAYLLLQFVDESGKIITTNQFSTLDPAAPPPNTMMPPPPRVFQDSKGALVQGTPVQKMASGWAVSYGPFDAYSYYPLAGRSGLIRLKAVIPNRSFTSVSQAITGAYYAPTSLTDTTKWAGSHVSNIVSFTLVGDQDGDGYYYPEPSGKFPAADCDDRNPKVNPRANEIEGNGIDDDCNPETPDRVTVAPGTIVVKAYKYVSDRGNSPRLTKAPIVGLPIRAYDKSTGSCAARYGVLWRQRRSIWLSCHQPDGAGLTDFSGKVEIAVPPGEYLVVAEYNHDRTPQSDDEIYVGEIVGDLKSSEKNATYLRIIETVEAKRLPCKSMTRYAKKKVSELLIVEPEYVVWDGKEAVYPFVFESEGDWSVTTAVNPPKGFVVDRGSLSAEVNKEFDAMEFIMKDVGGYWKPTVVTYTLKHKEKEERIKSKIDVKLSKKLAKEKGVDIHGNRIK